MGMAYFLADALALELSNRRRWGGEGGGLVHTDCISLQARSEKKKERRKRERKALDSGCCKQL